MSSLVKKITIELDEGDAALLLGDLTDKVRRIPSGIRERSPWQRICEQVSASFAGGEREYLRRGEQAS